MTTLLISLLVLGAGLYLIQQRRYLPGAAGVVLATFLLAPGLLHIILVAVEGLLVSGAPLWAALAGLATVIWGLRYIVAGR